MRARRDDVLNFESLGHIAKRTCAQCEPRRTEKILASSTPGIHGMRGYGKKPTNSWNATGAKDPPYQRAPHRVMGRLKWLCSGRKDRGGLQDTIFLPPIFGGAPISRLPSAPGRCSVRKQQAPKKWTPISLLNTLQTSIGGKDPRSALQMWLLLGFPAGRCWNTANCARH